MWRDEMDFLPKGLKGGGILPWVIGIMVGLMMVAFAASLSIMNVTERWSHELTGKLTVQVIQADSITRQRDVTTTLNILRTTPGIESAEELSHQDLLALLEPWLGAGNVSDDLPVPAMIAVKITDGMRVDMRALAATLSAKAPGAQLDDHGDWLGHLLSLAAAMEAVSFSALFLIGLTTMAIVIFATEARLSSEQETIEVVHLIGAEDSMIAKAFLRRFLLHGARGALGGAVGGVICILSMGAFTSRFPSGLVPDLGLNMAQFMWLMGVPVAATLATGLMAYVTVLRRLRERL
ncbi:MAG: hypothetical protein KAI28_07930 [Sphingomonadales bacterium]|nr:hypothetical protein [Sphingomonadales bacterium]